MQDKLAIAELITRWTFYRDQEAWDELASTFVPDGRISISWYDGPHEGFVAASRKIAARGGSLLKHQIGSPVITIRGDKAISEVNVIIMVRAQTHLGEVDTSSYARFYDRLIKNNGNWRFVDRVGVYEKDRIDPVDVAVLSDKLFEGLDAFPKPIKFLASNFASAGLSVSPTTVLDKSPEWETLTVDRQDWLRRD